MRSIVYLSTAFDYDPFSSLAGVLIRAQAHCFFMNGHVDSKEQWLCVRDVVEECKRRFWSSCPPEETFCLGTLFDAVLDHMKTRAWEVGGPPPADYLWMRVDMFLMTAMSKEEGRLELFMAISTVFAFMGPEAFTSTLGPHLALAPVSGLRGAWERVSKCQYPLSWIGTCHTTTAAGPFDPMFARDPECPIGNVHIPEHMVQPLCMFHVVLRRGTKRITEPSISTTTVRGECLMHTTSKKTIRSRNRKRVKKQQLADARECAATVIARAWKAKTHFASMRQCAASVIARAWKAKTHLASVRAAIAFARAWRRRSLSRRARRSCRGARRWRQLEAKHIAAARAATMIARAWRRRRLPPKDSVADEIQSRECTVCFADFSPHTPRHALPCGHTFCGDCAHAAIQSEACFTCREPLCQHAKAIRLFL